MRPGTLAAMGLGLAALALLANLEPRLDDSSPDATYRTSTFPRLVRPLRAMVPDLVETSSVRTPERNQAVGGVSDSQHLSGEAVDLYSPTVASGELLELAIRLGLPIDQGIAYPDDKGGHVHLSTRARGPNRGLIGVRRGSGYVWTREELARLSLEQRINA